MADLRDDQITDIVAAILTPRDSSAVTVAANFREIRDYVAKARLKTPNPDEAKHLR